MTRPRWGAWGDVSLGGKASQLSPEIGTFWVNEHPPFIEPYHVPGSG